MKPEQKTPEMIILTFGTYMDFIRTDAQPDRSTRIFP